ncbi:MAG: hypothetical protein H8E55_74695 [Pelagibacterales bacterium]|nr:hypothetical protein [Pelagibacterales bacterium]
MFLVKSVDKFNKWLLNKKLSNGFYFMFYGVLIPVISLTIILLSSLFLVVVLGLLQIKEIQILSSIFLLPLGLVWVMKKITD